MKSHHVKKLIYHWTCFSNKNYPFYTEKKTSTCEQRDKITRHKFPVRTIPSITQKEIPSSWQNPTNDQDEDIRNHFLPSKRDVSKVAKIKASNGMQRIWFPSKAQRTKHTHLRKGKKERKKGKKPKSRT